MLSINQTQSLPMSVRFRSMVRKIFILLILLCAALYFFAPYHMLKNYVLSEARKAFIQNQTFLTLNMESLRPYWLSGIALKKVNLQNSYENQRHPFILDTVHARLSLLPLFIGHATLKTEFVLDKGNTDFVASFPLFRALKGDWTNVALTSTFKHFDIEGVVDQGLGVIQESSNPAMVLLAPLIANISVGGFLNGRMEWNANNAIKMGSMNLSFDKLYFAVTDPALAIPLQKFKQATMDVGFDGRTYTIKNSTVFESENFYLKPTGTISDKSLNIDLLLIVSGSIEKNFGFLIPQMLNCPSSTMIDGVMNVRLTGTPQKYTCQ